MTGIVYKSTGSWYTVKTFNGKFYECRIKGRFRLEGIKSTNPIAVGDKVEFKLETKNNTETISRKMFALLTNHYTNVKTRI